MRYCALRNTRTLRGYVLAPLRAYAALFYLGLRLLPATGQYAYAVRYCALRNTRTLRGYVLAPLRAYAALFYLGLRLLPATGQYAYAVRYCALRNTRTLRGYVLTALRAYAALFLLSPICRYTLIAILGLFFGNSYGVYFHTNPVRGFPRVALGNAGGKRAAHPYKPR